MCVLQNRNEQTFWEILENNFLTIFFSFLNAESIELKAKDQCRGQISVSYRNEWKDVCFGDFPSQSEEELCRYLDCPGGNNSLKAKRQSSKVSEAKHEATGSDCGRVETNGQQSVQRVFLIENANTDVYVHRLCVSNAPDIDHRGGCFCGIFI